jgi:hypothetical protein
MIIFKGDTREFRATIEQDGVAVNPLTFQSCKAYVYNVTTDETVAQWSTDVADTDYDSMTITGNTLVFCLSEAQTAAATPGQVIVQMSMRRADPDAPGGYHRISKKGILGYIRNAKY